jgi:uncharacterized protein (TIGR03382 family)
MRTPPLVVLAALAACTPPEPRSRALGADALAELSRRIADGRTRFSRVEAPPFAAGPGYQARTGRLRVHVDADGLHVVDRASRRPDWVVDLRAVAFGRDVPAALPSGSLWAEDSSLELVRGSVVEFAENTEDGFEHGFRLRRRPDGAGPLRLDLRVTGAEPFATDDGALFLVPGRATLGWRGLAVFDADGRALPAHTEVAGDVLSVVVDDAGARWPVTVDPLLAVSEAALVQPFGATSGRSGYSIDVDGDQLLVGNPGDTGDPTSAHTAALFERNFDTEDEWGLLQTFDAGATLVEEGAAVALDDDTVVVGAPGSRRLNAWRRGPSGWTGPVTITDPVEFGAVFALDAGRLVVGKPGVGQIEVYDRYDFESGAPWTLLTTETTLSGQQFGAAVAIDENQLVVGAPAVNSVGLFALGDPLVNLVDLVGPPGQSYGAAVALAGAVLAVGAPAADRVEVFFDFQGTWTSVGDLPRPPDAGPGFGWKLALAGESLAVLDQGTPVRVHLFDRAAGNTFRHVQTLDTGAVTTPTLPVSLAMDEGIVAVGVSSDDTVHVWRREGEVWLEDVQLGDAAADHLGFSVATDDGAVAVGAPDADAAGPDAGEVWVFRDEGDGTFSLVNVLEGSYAGESFGRSVDVGADLIAIGAPDYTYASTESGRAEVWQIDGFFLNQAATLFPPAEATNLHFGDTISTDGSFVLVGQPGVANQTGSALLFERDGDAYPPGANEVLRGGASGDRSAASAVVVRGGWLLAGSGLYDGALGANQGRVLIEHLSGTSGPTVVPVATLLGSAAGERFGASLSFDGAVLAVGAPDASGLRGRVEVHRLGVGALALERSVSGGAANDQLGASVAVQGDRLFVGVPGRNVVEERRRNQGGRDNWGKVGERTGSGSFGEAVDADERILVVGAPDAGAAAQGRAHLYAWDANVPPLCRDDVFFVREDQLGAASVADNDADPNVGDTLVFTVADGPDHAATFTLDPDGQATYQATTDWWGTDTFTVTVGDGALDCTSTATITVAEVNDRPVAGAPGPYAVDEDEELVVTAPGLLVGSTDPDAPGVSETYTTAVASSPEHGAVVVLANGGFSYTPDADWFGTDTFTFTVRDGRGGTSDPRAVEVVVAPVNDPPVLLQSALTVTGIAEDAVYVSPPPGLGQVAVDPDGDPLTIVLRSAPANGAFTLESNTYWRYQPVADWSGVDSFVYAVSDGTAETADVTVDLVVDPRNDAPVARADGPFPWPEDETFVVTEAVVLGNDGDVDPGDTLSAELEPGSAVNATVSFVGDAFQLDPDPDFVGTASFRYRVSDGTTTSAPVTVSVAFSARNDAPVAQDDQGRSDDGAPVSGDVLANDGDVDGDALVAALLVPPTQGSVELGSDGSWTYTPRPGFTGADGFTYAASDPSGAADTAVVTLTVFAAEPTGPTDTGATGTGGCDAPRTFYTDRDGDGFGDPDAPHEACAPGDWVEDASDCDDFAADVFPGAVEVSGDGRDQDCDGRDNAPSPVGACDTSGAPALAPLALVALLAVRRRRTSC